MVLKNETRMEVIPRKIPLANYNAYYKVYYEDKAIYKAFYLEYLVLFNYITEEEI